MTSIAPTWIVSINAFPTFKTKVFPVRSINTRGARKNTNGKASEAIKVAKLTAISIVEIGISTTKTDGHSSSNGIWAMTDGLTRSRYRILVA